ncbi:MAG: NmrA family NAD(P)-binding protein, partial [Sinobacteraceae bacterium]|nr:NmrA family NAD(P)-binding protein [Nevskiaceae bacterium]
MVLLTGITGNIGGATARALLGRGVRFRALVRDLGKAAPWAERGVELVQGDIEDPSAVKRALAGVDAALLVMPNGEFQERAELSFVRTAKEAGLAWIIKLSSPEAVRGTTSPIPLAHIAAEDAIKASGMNWTLVRPSFYMQNFRGSVKGARATGKLSMPMGNGTVALTDNDDAGQFIAHILTDNNRAQHYGQCYDITGPDPVMNFHQVAQAIGEAIGQPVTYDDCDPKAFQEAIRPFHRNQWHSDAVARLFAE